MVETRFLTALDVLFPRGNKLFGEGQHGEALMPPWPSAVAGAIRSRMLAEAGASVLDSFAKGSRPAGPLGDALGTPAEPGTFRISWFSLARRKGQTAEPIFPLPADLISDKCSAHLIYIEPQELPSHLQASTSTPLVPVLRQAKVSKPEHGFWLWGPGLGHYLRGEPIKKPLREEEEERRWGAHTVFTRALWRTDARLGIALDAETRSAKQGLLYTADAIALTPDWAWPKAECQVGLLACIAGANSLVPQGGLLRFGGDGRGARIEACNATLPEPDWERIGREKKFRLILLTPGLFENGWRIPGLSDDGAWQGPHGISARLVSAAVPRAQVVSGWDLAKWEPKPALRAAPVGSVYWFDAAGADESALVSAVRTLREEGFGCMSNYPDKTRLAEGFNNILVANWAAT
ncbi:MAG TPA: type III-B CRISPR module-associated Cmr3 family protein [Terriglobia bacterium]|nr:type III-B CRISPR module-associated Cmr3 family protein [Terriglobia bacterium]